MESRLLALSIAGMSTLTIGLASDQAFAQDTTPPVQGPRMMMHQRGPMMDPAAFKARLEQRLERLHAQLKLTSDQEPAWTAYRADSLSRIDMFTKDRPAPGSLRDADAITRLEKMLEMTKQHEKVLTQQLESTRTFYTKLTPEQQKTFNAATSWEWERQGPGPRRGGRGGPGGPAANTN